MESSHYSGLDYRYVEFLQPYQLACDLAQRGELLPAYIILDWVLAYGSPCPEWQHTLKTLQGRILHCNQGLKRSKRLFYTRRHSRESLDARILSFLIPAVEETQRDAVIEMVESLQDPHLRIPLLMSCAAQWGELSDWLRHVNQYLSLFRLSGCMPSRGSGCRRLQAANHVLQDIEMEPSGDEASGLSCGLVTVIMSSFNSGDTIDYAIKSILGQSYCDLELIVVDDASSDQTLEILAEHANRDSRVVPVFRDVNSGPYECRNVALGRARGAYITTHDSDDLCHPQRLRMQVDFLRAQPDRAAVIGQWLRIGPHGHVLYHNKRGGAFLHGGLATMMYRRDVINRIGCYDNVRYSADTEYLFRLRRVIGADAVGTLRAPLVLAAQRQRSLTASAGTRTDSFLGDSESRAAYRSAWEQWHAETDPERLVMRSNAAERMFQAPEDMVVSPRGVRV